MPDLDRLLRGEETAVDEFENELTLQLNRRGNYNFRRKLDRTALLTAMAALADHVKVEDVAKQLNVRRSSVERYLRRDGTPKQRGQAILNGTLNVVPNLRDIPVL